VRIKPKILQLVAVAGLLLLAAGCGGFTASKSISPASFLLPGLLKADPPPGHFEQILPAQEPDLQAVVA
jgi:hypothetical protein